MKCNEVLKSRHMRMKSMCTPVEYTIHILFTVSTVPIRKLGSVKGALVKEGTCPDRVHVRSRWEPVECCADACPGAARPVDSSPRCAHICPQITPRLYRSPLPYICKV